MIRFHFHPTPNPAKIALLLEEAGLPYEAVLIDTSKGEKHTPAFRAINPSGKVPAIIDTEGRRPRQSGWQAASLQEGQRRRDKTRALPVELPPAT